MSIMGTTGQARHPWHSTARAQQHNRELEEALRGSQLQLDQPGLGR